MVLALIAERAGGTPFHDLVTETVLAPAELTGTAYLRSDLLPSGAAVGYLEDGRSNVPHLPVRGNGEGGAHTTAGDMSAFWRALYADRIVPLAEMVRSRGTTGVGDRHPG